MRRYLPATVGVALVVMACGSLRAQSSAENPALERFSRAITFYLSFDGTLRADLANGKPDPREVTGDAQFQPGLYGKAMTMTDATKPGTYVIVGYPMLDNVDVTKPGSLVVWLSPYGWRRNEPIPYIWPVKIMGNVGVQFMFGRMNQPSEPIYLWGKLGNLKDVCLMHGSSLGWKDGEWHLWVMNWRSSSVEFSLDGGPLVRQDLPGKINADGDRAGLLFLSQGGPSCRYLLDELLVLNRPLTEEEIKFIYEQGMKQSHSVTMQTKQ